MNNEDEVKPTLKTTPKKVTSTRDVDFPSLGWGISANDTRELPSDPKAQEVILSSEYISLTK